MSYIAKNELKTFELRFALPSLAGAFILLALLLLSGWLLYAHNTELSEGLPSEIQDILETRKNEFEGIRHGGKLSEKTSEIFNRAIETGNVIKFLMIGKSKQNYWVYDINKKWFPVASSSLIFHSEKSSVPKGKDTTFLHKLISNDPKGETLEFYVQINSDRTRSTNWINYEFGYAGILILMLFAWLIPYMMMRKQLTKLENTQGEIKKLALEDPVTGLPNRGSFNQMLDQAIAYADRYETKCAILLLDLDNFKNVNDTLGHNAGDELLNIIGQRINSSLRGHEVVSRIGGDEFSILLNPVHHNPDIAAIAQRIIDIVSKPVDIDGVTLVPSTSIGISTFPTDASDRIELFAHADISLYKAKEIEKGTYYFFDESMREEVAFTKKTEISLRKALKDEELDIHYQPQVELNTGEIVGFEALVRWNHPDYGLIGPEHFIQLADDRGLAKHVGNFVIDRVLIDRDRLKRMFSEIPRLAFNISPSHFRHPGFSESLIERLRQLKIRPGNIVAEITEDCLIGRGTEKCHQILSDIQAAGVEFALDDFGTGYASLTHLRDLPVSEIKVDRSFIESLLSSEINDAIVQSIIDLANCLDLRVIAEGVETREQMLTLQDMGCNYAQGYYFSRPVSFDRACELLQSGSIRHNIELERENFKLVRAANF